MEDSLQSVSKETRIYFRFFFLWEVRWLSVTNFLFRVYHHPQAKSGYDFSFRTNAGTSCSEYVIPFSGHNNTQRVVMEIIGPFKGIILTPDIAKMFQPTPDIQGKICPTSDTQNSARHPTPNFQKCTKSTLDTVIFKSTSDTPTRHGCNYNRQQSYKICF